MLVVDKNSMGERSAGIGTPRKSQIYLTPNDESLPSKSIISIDDKSPNLLSAASNQGLSASKEKSKAESSYDKQRRSMVPTDSSITLSLSLPEIYLNR